MGYEKIVHDLVGGAIEIARNDPEFSKADLASFSMVMWSDSDALTRLGCNATIYGEAMKDAFRRFRALTDKAGFAAAA
jgi:hypothetical protein